MNRRFLYTSILLTLSFALLGCSKYTLKGTVTDKATGQALEEVNIKLTVDGQPRESKTNRKGEYRVAKDRKKIGLIEATKDGYESFSKDQIGYEKDLSFWLRPTAEETVKKVVLLEREAAIKDEKRWEDVYNSYLHPNYQAQYPLPDFLEKERALKTYFSMITEDAPVIKGTQILTNWRDSQQNKVYQEVKKVTVELTTKTGDQTSKITKDFYLALADDSWQFFWINR